MMNRIKNTSITLLVILVSYSTLPAQLDHSKFDKVLGEYVNIGLVDYKSLKSDSTLDEYLSYLSGINPDTIKDENEILAFWINAYNAFTLKVIVDNYPVKSINDLHSGGRVIAHVLGTTIWDDDFISINGKSLSLNNIEHDIIREDFDKPEIHFALVCAAISCPQLRDEAYTGIKVNEQLTDQAKIFFSNKTKNLFSVEEKTAKLSKILDWYEDDFGENDEEVLEYILQFLDVDLKNKIAKSISEWDIEYLDYSWNLNEQK